MPRRLASGSVVERGTVEGPEAHPTQAASARRDDVRNGSGGYSVNRYYDPAAAVFVTVDPIVSTTLQPYGYAGQDPLDQYDLDGRCDPETCPESIGPGAAEAEAKGNAGIARQEEAEGRTPPTNAEARAQARRLNYRRLVKDPPFNSHGQQVFTNGRLNISADRDMHLGVRAWKVFDRNGRRLGTFDWATLQRRLGD